MEKPVREILIIDDSVEDRQAWGRFLANDEAVEYIIREAETGEEGLQLVIEKRPDCVLLDYRLPDYDGITLLPKILSLNEGQAIPIVILSGEGNEAVAVKALHNGAQDYVVKNSVTAIGLQRTLQNAVEKVDLQREIDRQRADLESKNHELEQASAFKSQFLANMSHEIRTPMNGVIGLTEILLQTPLNVEQKGHLEMIQRSGKALLTIINDILDLSKIEAGKLVLELVPFDLRQMVRDTTRLSLPAIELRKNRLSLSIAEGIPKVLISDPHRLGQVLANLLSNAVKFTENGSISLKIFPLKQSPQEVRLRFELEDSGLGIEEKILGQLFKPFHQAKASTSRTHGGTGLGLSISKCLVEMMEGQIGCESTVGKGSKFWFEVECQIDTQKSLDPISGGSAVTTADKKIPRILLVEDDPVNQVVASKMLELLGYSVKIAGNGRIALGEFSNGSFDLILMDCRMPEMDGYETTAAIRIKEKGSAARVPILALSANAFRDEYKKCMAVGMDDCLSKPVMIEELSAKLTSWLTPKP